MFKVADAHCDTLFSIGVANRAPEECTITKSRLEQGGVALQTLALFAGGQGPAGHPYQKARDMLSVRDKVGIEIFTRELPDALPDSPAAVISLEGGEILEGSLSRLDEFYSRYRIRLIALTWNNENEIGHPSAKNGDGLKPFGKHLLREMDKRGIYADVSHLSEKGFWDIVDLAELPPVASHSNARELCDIHRNLRDEQIKAIIEKKGFIGINFFSAFIVPEGKGTLEDVYRHIDRILSMGGEDVLGFGSDFDGIDSAPEGLETPADFPLFLDFLSKKGYSDALLAKIAGQNYFDLLKRAENAAVIK